MITGLMLCFYLETILSVGLTESNQTDNKTDILMMEPRVCIGELSISFLYHTSCTHRLYLHML